MILRERTVLESQPCSILDGKDAIKTGLWFSNLVQSSGNFFSNHTSKFPEIHTEIIGRMDLITSNHYHYPSPY